jgi:hypothetical protein
MGWNCSSDASADPGSKRGGPDCCDPFYVTVIGKDRGQSDSQTYATSDGHSDQRIPLATSAGGDSVDLFSGNCNLLAFGLQGNVRIRETDKFPRLLP